MAFLFGKPPQAKQTPAAGGMQVQTSALGKVVAVIFGTVKVAPNLIWYGDFTSTPQSQRGGKGGAGGGGGGKGGSGGSSYLYQTALQFGICEGPINGFGTVWKDKNKTTTAALGMSEFLGSYPQAAWDYLITNHAKVTQDFNVPASSPYTITVCPSSEFIDDYGVVGPSVVAQFIRINSGTPSSGQYLVTFPAPSGATGSGQVKNVYTFAAADKGKKVVIKYYDGYNAVKTANEKIPNAAPYEIEIFTQKGKPLTDQGVTSTRTAYLPVGGAPATGQYSVSGGVYTFNSAQAGVAVQISYASTEAIVDTDEEGNQYKFQALGYNGIAHVDVAKYQLGDSPHLSNHNFEVFGLLSNSVGALSPPSAPTLSDQAGGTLSATTYYVVVTWVNSRGETLASAESNRAVSSNRQLIVTAPGSAPSDATGWNVYVSNTAGGGSGAETKQNTGALALGVNWLMPATGLIAGVGIPSKNTTSKRDADPSQVIVEIASNAKFGAGLPSDKWGSLTLYQDYVLAEDLLISPRYEEQSRCSEVLEAIALATNSEFVDSEGLLKVIPYGDTVVTGNGHTYTPPAAPLYNLTLDDLIFDEGNDPIEHRRTRVSDSLNVVRLECLNRDKNYDPDPVEVKDQASIDLYGERPNNASQTHVFCDKTIGLKSAGLQLQRQAIQNFYTFKTDQRYIVLEPMDVITITDGADIGVTWVRIKEMTLNSDDTITFISEEYLNGTGESPQYAFQQSAGFNVNYNSSPGDVNTPVIFEPTAQLANALEVWMGLSGGAQWGGADIYISTDGGVNYALAGRTSGSARTGVLTTTLPSVTEAVSGQTIDSTNTVGVSLSESNGSLLPASLEDALAVSSLCWSGGEFFSYRDATLTGLNSYTLGYFVRGAYESDIVSHSSGDQFVRCDENLFKLPYTPDRIGQTIAIKFLSFNKYGGGQGTLDEVEPFFYTFQGVAYKSPLNDVTNFRQLYVGNVAQGVWDEVTDFRPVLYEIRKGASADNGMVLGRYAHPPFNFLGNDTYWVAAVSQPVAGLTVYSENWTSLVVTGANLVQNVIQSWDEKTTGWSGTLSGFVIVSGGNVITTGSNSIMALADIMAYPDVMNYGNEQGSGVYTIPSGHQVALTTPEACLVTIEWLASGQNVNSDILSLSDVLSQSDVLDSSSNQFIDVYPEIRLSTNGGSSWSAWQKYVAGYYYFNKIDARMQIITNNPQVQAVLQQFIFTVDVPDRVDHFNNVSIASGSGTAITFRPDGGSNAAFNGGNGGASLPNVQVTINNAQAGDLVVVSSLTLSGCNVQILNGGSGVARNVNILVQGY